MFPNHAWSLIAPFPSVVRSSVGSWNIRIVPSVVACTSAPKISRLREDADRRERTAFDPFSAF
jgi:hypothetical protein